MGVRNFRRLFASSAAAVALEGAEGSALAPAAPGLAPAPDVGPVRPVGASSRLADDRPRPSLAVTVRWPQLLGVSAGMAAVLLVAASRYGYSADELYFRLLGRHGFAWGYTDEPPLLPLMVRAFSSLFGDTVVAIRIPAALCAGIIVLLGSMITAELGGRGRAQLLTALGLGTSTVVLSVGHAMTTNTVDMVGGTALCLCILRALLRSEPRWWFIAGVVLGLGLYAKWTILMLPVTLVTGLAFAGPRAVLRQREFLGGALLAAVIALPNLTYQVTHDLPQLQMARALSATDGAGNRILLLPALALVLGLVLTPVWVAGLIGLLRDPAWRAARGLGVAFLVALGLVAASGGNPDYLESFLVVLFAVGSVRSVGWASGRVRRRWLLSVAVPLSVAIQLVAALPLLPPDALAVTGVLNDTNLESVGWPALAQQVTAAYNRLPGPDQRGAVIITDTIGEAGALNRYAPGLPAVYSGDNQLYQWGPPPQSADVVVTVGISSSQLARGFARCQVVSVVNNGLGVPNNSQGAPITVCRGRRANWSALWPSYRHLSS